MNPGSLVIRTDASVAIGTGHVMRCLALAQAWRDSGGKAVLAATVLTPALARRLGNEGIDVAIVRSEGGSAGDALELTILAHQRGATWIVVDGYHFDSAYQRSIKDAGFRLLLIDDTGQCGPYCADFVLNQNPYANEEMYCDREPSTHLLLGPDYTLLRKEFVSWRNWRRDFAPVARHLLIVMGGSDPENYSSRVIDAAQRLDMEALDVTVVIGGSNTHRDSLHELVSRLPGNIRLQVDVHNMAELMARADLAVSAAGSTCYELALLQVPMVLIALAENQVPTARAMANLGAAVDSGWFANFAADRFIPVLRRLILDGERRCSLAENARRLVDGTGAHRVSGCLLAETAARTEMLTNQKVGVC